MILQTSSKLSTNLAKLSRWALVALALGLVAPALQAQALPSQKAIADSALSLVGRKNLRFEGRSFPWDCSGTVMASLWLAGVDLIAEYQSYPGNGVARLHEIAVRRGLAYDLPLPEIGDIVFWDDTYDKNDDGKWNDPLTHAGIVVAVDPDGTVTYVHHDYRRGIVTARMNLFLPGVRNSPEDGEKQINSPLRMTRDRYIRPSQYLSGQLFAGFGRFHVILDELGFKKPAGTDPPPNP